MYLCDCGDIYDFNRFCFKNWSHKNPIWDLILMYITEFSIKSYACTQILRPSQKKNSWISSYFCVRAILFCNEQKMTYWWRLYLDTVHRENCIQHPFEFRALYEVATVYILCYEIGPQYCLAGHLQIFYLMSDQEFIS